MSSGSSRLHIPRDSALVLLNNGLYINVQCTIRMGDAYPAHASPAFTPIASPQPKSRPHGRSISNLQLDDGATEEAPPLISPVFTPPHTPSIEGQRHDRQPRSIPVLPVPDTNGETSRSKYLEKLPEVECKVRARIPTISGQEMWLNLYHNDTDEKEHLAIVFGSNIRSKSLDAPRPGETERARMIRGAYVGTLFPGRTSSRVEQIRKDEGVPTPRSLPKSASSSQISEMVDESPSAEYDPDPPLVRIHSECYTGETVWSARCDCGEQLDEAARLMSLPQPTPLPTPTSGEGQTPLQHQHLPPSGGVIIYLRQEGRGIGLLSKLEAYNLQDLGHDTMEANLLLRHPGDARSYGMATAMLLDLGLGGERGIKLLTNNPEKVRAVEGPNREIRVVERVPMIPLAWKTGGKEGINSPEVEKYISTKIEKFKHMFTA